MDAIRTTSLPLRFLLSMLSQSYNIIIDCSVSVPGHGRELVDDIKGTEFF